MKLPDKDVLGAKLMDYPLLRQLLYERWFRLAFAAFVLIFVFLGLFLPKIWRVSRPDFRPIIRVSGLDLVQAWSLKRTALKLSAAGRFDDANYAWQAALANNRSDPDLVRGALTNLLKSPHPRENARQGLQESLWLLQLTETNSLPDLELAARALFQFRYYDLVLQLAQPRLKELTPGLADVYLKALFDQGLIDTFAKRWDEIGPKAANDPELGLYHAAYLVGWGPPASMADARRQLQTASQDPALRLVALRLQLLLHSQAQNAAAYGQTLKTLEDLREDSLSYHVGYWRLLAAVGQKDQAVRLARDYSFQPASAIEVVELGGVYSELELHDTALQLFQRYTKEFRQVPIFWIAYANELVEVKRWDDLRTLALQMRGEDGSRDQLAGFSYFLEGRAELALGRNASSVAAFRKAADYDCPFPVLGQRVAIQLLQFGHPDLARQLLARLEKPLQAELSYWLILFSAADQLKDADLLLRAAERAYEIKPQDPRVMNNYAAALIINRKNPQQVIQLTLQLYSDNPNLLHAVVNHSAALLLNDRPKEAEALLSRVSTNNLTRAQLALYNYDLFQTYYSLRDYPRAWAISDRIEAQQLYPPQQRWLDKTRGQLPPRQKSG